MIKGFMDLLTEELITLGVAADELPRVNGAPIHHATVRTWARVGLHGIKLETVCVGGRRLTSREAVKRFLVDLNAGE